MDLEEWEILPEDGYLEIQYDAGKKIFSRKYCGNDSNTLYKNNYFICSSQDSSEFMESTSRVPKHLHVPIQLSTFVNMEPINNSFKDVPDSEIPLEADYDPVPQVFFKKTIENKSVDMKMDSPKLNNKSLIPQMDPATIQSENRANPMKDEALDSNNSLQKTENDSEGMNIWKWSLNGFGAICSFGVVAASICIIILGGRKQTNQPHQQNQKVPFHIFAEDKRMKQVVHHATRLNEAISTIRGVQGARAQITVGGYYDCL